MIPPQNAPPPETVGGQPVNGYEVNSLVASHLRRFVDAQRSIGQDRDWLAAADLKVEPYLFTAAQETDIKSAILTLDDALDAIDMTFVNRVLGMY